MANLTLTGFLQAGGEGCGCDGGSGSVNQRLGLRCSPGTYQTIIETASPIAIQTPGSAGDAFVDLAILGDLIGVEFLYVKTSTPMVLCIDAGSASLTSDPITIPTGFLGGETLTATLDALAPVVVTFDVGDQSLAQVVARINAAFALAGLPTPRCVAVGANKLTISAIECGPDSSVVIGAAPAIPFPSLSAAGNGAHIPVAGTFLAEFPPYPNCPTRVEVSGIGSITILAAGRTTA